MRDQIYHLPGTSAYTRTVIDGKAGERRFCSEAEAMAGRMPGTAALKMVADDETGELESATILGQFGEVPEDFAESLQGGWERQHDPAGDDRCPPVIRRHMGTSRHGGMLMPNETEPKNGATPIHTDKGKAPAPKTEEGEALEGADPSDVLPEDPDEQNDLA